ncbi:ABC transporter ATP-binding protein [Thermoactinomyces sp. CICC 10521]|uniref:ABC transporter ATP-binding protein n=1 Tax=Thermoactinomyces sp. CICC 10521 TaxID=2767426 RepID=UPI0018DBCF47|nr:ABC transporter ATP-binding protein [Thermoactinomyces sp. CICC 10521]MBH8608697.1 ABC transporter ATP-binding protein [Thermoactinomyces sp. CICC 10521]
MNPAAQVERLRLKFPGSESLLFKDVSVSFQQGEKVLLLGPSGCGKSTLLQVLCGLIPHSIEVPMKADKVVIPRSWGYVFQDPDSQFCMPYADEEIAFVLENLQVPRKEMQEKIQKLLQAVGLEFSDPHVPIQTLSGGMKQRLALASALALEPDVLFLDEPTAMLDPAGTKEIWKLVKKVGHEKTLIIVEHKIDHVLDFVGRICLFDDKGNIIADGPKEHIFSQYRDTLEKDGIWYPGVWETYLRDHQDQFQSPYPAAREVLKLENFRGYRKREAKIEISQAHVNQGEWIAITGKNGAGKSTFLQALMQLLKTSGTCHLNGRPVAKIKNLTDLLTFVFQNPEFQFVTHSVYDEIAYSLRLKRMSEEEIREKVEEMLRLFHLKGQEMQHPYQLSMGQKRRLSVAASIVNKQPVLLLDEPTFGQDAKNTFRLLELLEHYRKQGTAILMVTHDERIARQIATRRWVIEDGRLVKDIVNSPWSLEAVDHAV